MSTPRLSVLKQALFKLFQNFDENNDKLIDFGEFKKAMIHSGFVDKNALKLDEQISQLFAKFDTNGSGTIKYTEFVDGGSQFTAFLNHLNIPFIDDNIDDDIDDDIDLLRDEIIELKHKIFEIKDLKERTETNLKICIQKNNAMREEIDELRNDKNILKITKNELKNEINKLKTDKIELESLSKLKNELKHNDENEFESEIFELNEKLRETIKNIEIYKNENNKCHENIKLLSSKIEALQKLNKQLKTDNNVLFATKQELEIYCNEIEIINESLENKINDLNNNNEEETLYDINNINNNIITRKKTKTRTRKRTVHMLHFEEPEINEYQETDDEYINLYDIEEKQHEKKPILSRQHRKYINNNNNNKTDIYYEILNKIDLNHDLLKNIKNDLNHLNTNESNIKSWWFGIKEWW